ncbi:uncharacterized protein LOC131851775 [Achroia grisella]|uniref:uncharacterized protein LOC131851775 n=1 Tax=Achroia grisella TaxID=688607 RepID=UPI0027D2F691|nr:uncharacterized protein LOC131851775 [Achroia grisella]
MANDLPGHPKLSSTRILSTSANNDEHKKYNIEVKPGTSYEVFRNNTTAVEVLVKEVADRINKKQTTNKSSVNTPTDHTNITTLREINEKLARELIKSNSTLAESRDDFKTIISLMKKQLDEANGREIEIRSRYLNAQLENEKFKTLLEYKTNLVKKFKRELISLKRIIKFVVKGISYTNIAENFTLSSDHEYDEFKMVLQRDCRVKFANLLDGTMTLDSTALKDNKDSFEKRY